MPFDIASGLHLPGQDHELARREERLADLGLDPHQGDAQFDEAARRLAEAAGTPYAMVNLITDQQYFVGLHTPDAPSDPTAEAAAPVGRIMSREHGYCPAVLERRKPLVLHDVYSAPRFSSNPVVDELGIRVYYGAPLIDHRSGTVLGTVCAVGPEPRTLDTSRDALEMIKQFRDQVLAQIYRRAGEPLP
ncbi:GAF domain-containing protein [Streptomyces sp. VRA16 Mangrove soil]|uniref:GAF domain-containing protein n=1 Tax=Streptomyces sp. VRA16 Mangrove soil TaxID=2817434 RepID=UPI001A9F1E95|nr:GAF domain-containing protein [Streptomyces sp. VRA16 Mangrove soil]MBO1329911.1 GAF domain-containing protein [Streptomyces sp. VRA16 Mangrove soil]